MMISHLTHAQAVDMGIVDAAIKQAEEANPHVSYVIQNTTSRHGYYVADGHNPITRYATKDEAEAVAVQLRIDFPNYTYAVRALPR